MARKTYIEDSEELRAVIADLKSKTEGTAPAGDTQESKTTETGRLRDPEDAMAPKDTITPKDTGRIAENKKTAAAEKTSDYEPDENGEYPPESYDEDDYTDDSFGEEIAYDSFEDRINDTILMDGIGEAVTRQEEERRSRQAMERASAREKRVVRDQDSRQRPVKERRVSSKRKKKKDDNVIISLEGVSKSYVKGVPALNNVNIRIRKGEFVFIVGGSGSGKSTLIRLLLRELQPTRGQIMVNGFRVDNMWRSRIPKLRRSIGVVFQDFRLLHDRNVYENVAFAQRIIQTPAREMKRNVPDILATVGLAGKYKAKPEELSGGEQQRVALARALVNKPPILLCDEPTGNLDPRMTIEIMNLLDRINQNGTTVVVVTHNEKIVNDMRKRVITIKKGVVISDEEKGGYIDEDY